MRRSILVLTVLFASLAPAIAAAQAAPDDRVAFGSPVHVAAGEVVRDAVSFGGDTVVDGEVRGDAVSFGGSVILRGEGRVHGDTAAFGGTVRQEPVPDGAIAPAPPNVARGCAPTSPIERVGAWVGDFVRSALAHVLIFLLGLLLIGVARERLRAMQTTMIKDGIKTAGAGLLGYVAAVVAIVLLAVTIVGIPIAIVVALALPVATYVGLAAAATIIGAALPLPQLKDREVLQLAAGVAVLFVASLVPVAGGIATAIAACLGFGALVRTRFAQTPPADLPNGDGAYRSPAAV